MTIRVVVLLAVIVGVAWLMWTATRLDRLHLKAEAARAIVGESLQRRAAVAIELASTGLTDPASAVLLMTAAVRARANPADWVAQTELTHTLRAVAPAVPADELAPVREAQRDASLARQVHNDLVARAIDLRGRRRVRWFRLAGGAAQPTPVDYDDADI